MVDALDKKIKIGFVNLGYMLGNPPLYSRNIWRRKNVPGKEGDFVYNYSLCLIRSSMGLNRLQKTIRFLSLGKGMG